jgi:hypothetical protein
MQIIMTDNEKKWAKLILYTSAIYAILYYVNKQSNK